MNKAKLSTAHLDHLSSLRTLRLCGKIGISPAKSQSSQSRDWVSPPGKWSSTFNNMLTNGLSAASYTVHEPRFTALPGQPFRKRVPSVIVRFETVVISARY